MKLIISVFSLFFAFNAQAQRLNNVLFFQLPQDSQLYPRNAQNKGIVPISGRVESLGWQYLSVKVFRNNISNSYIKLPLTYGANGADFSTNSTIIAEKAEYSIRVYLCHNTDSTLIVTRNNVVSGDVYVLTGQSNATCLFNDTRNNEYCRTFGNITGTYNTEPYNPNDTTWSAANQIPYVKNVGEFGFEIQQRITDTYNIPTCFINSGFNWSSAAQHANRNPANPTDLTTGYGRMLYRLQKAGIVGNVKALIYRQGETEAYGEGYDFIGNFTRFYNFIKSDLLNLSKIYVFQIDIIQFARPSVAPVVRDDQRKLEDNYTDIHVVPSIGTIGFNGLHYSSEGYAQNALETFRLIARDFYGSTDIDNIKSPNIRKAYFSKVDRKEITLEFEAGQDLSWQEEHRGQRMVDFIYLDGISGNVQSGIASGRRVILQLYNSSNATKISYLPTYVPENASYFPYTGPFILNRRGMRAFSFYQVNLENIPTCITTNTCCVTNESLISGNWNEPSIWSCNRIPNSTDNTIINAGHIITTQNNLNSVKSLTNKGVLKLGANNVVNIKLP